MGPNRRSAGFTLVELLVAMTLLGFLTVLLFGGLRFGTRAWERSQENYSDENAVRNAENLLADAIAQAYPLPLHSGTQGLRVDFDGQAQQMTWLTTAGDGADGMRKLRLSASSQDGGMSLDLFTRAELAAAAEQNSRRLLGKVDSFEIAYMGRRKGEKAARWAADWHDQPRLPDLIRVRVHMSDTRLIWTDLVIAPRITADAGCVLDVLTNDCRGR
jgi:general secretion pathway protein J